MENSNQPAFPVVAGDQSSPDDRLLCEGLTKREYLAGLAMQGMLSNSVLFMGDVPEDLVQKSVKAADELLTALT